MARPKDIPEWAWEKAALYVGTTDRPDLARQWIARAILSAVEEENEACAAEMDRRERENANTIDTQAAYRNAAKAIRNRKGA